MRRHSLLLVSLFTACLTATPAFAAPQIQIPGGQPLHFLAAVSADRARPVPHATALEELRELYRLESEVLQTYTEVKGIRLYGPEESGRLWAIHEAAARREAALGLPGAYWDLPARTYAIPPDEYPSVTKVADMLERSAVPAHLLDGLPVFLLPMQTAAWDGTAITYQAPWLDEGVILPSGAPDDALLHELGHVVHRQLLTGSRELDGYLAERAEGAEPTGDHWADSPMENLAEDFRLLVRPPERDRQHRHLGSWGEPSGSQLARLERLVAAAGDRPGWYSFSLADRASVRFRQPLTDFTFATDEAEVQLRAPGLEGAVSVEVCSEQVCAVHEGELPLSVPLADEGQYRLTVVIGHKVWLHATVARAARSDGGALREPERPCQSHAGMTVTASWWLRAVGEQQGWGPFPLTPSAGLLGNGWDRDPAASSMRWARLTGDLSPFFAWEYQPQDLVVPALLKPWRC